MGISNDEKVVSRDLLEEASFSGKGGVARGNPTFGIRSDDIGTLFEFAGIKDSAVDPTQLDLVAGTEGGVGIKVPTNIRGELLIEGEVLKLAPLGLGGMTGINAGVVLTIGVTSSISLLLYLHMF